MDMLPSASQKLFSERDQFMSERRLRIGVIQRVLPTYRQPFFERLAIVSGATLSVFAGKPLPDEGLKCVDRLSGVELFSAVNHYWQGSLGLVCWQNRLWNWLRVFDPDVLVLEASPRILSHWFAISWMHRRRRPVLGWGLGELDRTGARWLRRARQRFAWTLARSLDGMIAYSTKAKQDYIMAGVPAERVFIAYNSIDNSESERYLIRWRNDITWVKPWKESLGFDASLPLVLFVGRLISQKRVDLLIEACAPLERCQLLIVGDGPARAELEQYAKMCAKRVRFVGHQSGEALAQSFIASDVFVLPGAGGLAIHQAMSYGKPVIVSFGDGTESDLVRQGQNGFFFRTGDVQDLRAKLSQILDDPVKIREMGQASLTIIRAEINLDKMVDGFLNAVNDTVKRFQSAK